MHVILVEVFEVSVMHGHILDLETSPDEIIGCPLSCFVIVKEGTDMGEVSVIQIADSPCHVANGVHHEANSRYFFFH